MSRGFEAKIKCDNDIEMLEKLIYCYGIGLKLLGQNTRTLRPKLTYLLAIYIKFGYNAASKKIAMEVTGLTEPAITSLNSELTKRGYLLHDKMDTRIRHLDPNLERMKQAIDKVGCNDLSYSFNFTIG